MTIKNIIFDINSGLANRSFFSFLKNIHPKQSNKKLFTDNLILSIGARLNAVVKVVGKLPDFSLPLPEDLSYIDSIEDLK